MTQPRKIVEIEWTDAITGSAEEWTEPKNVRHQTMPTKSVGYILKETKDAITLASLVNKNHVGMTITIPKRMIDKRTELTAKP